MASAERRRLKRLASAEGQAALQEAAAAGPSEADYLLLSQRLSSRHGAELARAAVVQAILRRKAAAKFAAADRMFFTREALEQATPEDVAHARARRFVGASVIFDLGCGLGGDTLALARAAPVVAVDQDLDRLTLLQINAAALGLEDRVRPVCADVLHAAWRLPAQAAVFCDPSRRKGHRRLRSIEQYEPPLGALLPVLTSAWGAAAKISPAVDLAELSGLEAELEFVAVADELKEAVLWFGEFRTGRRRATVLPGPHSLTAEAEPDLDAGPPLAILYEPNPAVIRAGLVRTLGAALGARLLDPTIAFLTANHPRPTPFARAYRVLDAFPFQLKRLRAYLRGRQVGRLTIKKRGSAIKPEELERRLRLSGDRAATLVLSRVMGKHVVLVVEPLVPVDEPAD